MPSAGRSCHWMRARILMVLLRIGGATKYMRGKIIWTPPVDNVMAPRHSAGSVVTFGGRPLRPRGAHPFGAAAGVGAEPTSWIVPGRSGGLCCAERRWVAVSPVADGGG